MSPNLDEFTKSLHEDDPHEITQDQEDVVLKPLLGELSIIKDVAVRGFVRSILLRAGPFWEMPAFFEANFYPPDTYGFTGNVIHTKRVFRATLLLAHTHQLIQQQKDIALAAALLHGVTKGRYTEDFDITFDPMHPYTVQLLVNMAISEDEVWGTEQSSNTVELDRETIDRILKLIRGQMGAASLVPETRPGAFTFENILHTAVSIAVNLHVLIDGDQVEEWRWDYQRFDDNVQEEGVADPEL